VDYAAFEKGDAEYGGSEEVVRVFATSPILAKILEYVQRELNWMKESDVVDMIGRYNVGFSHHICSKAMCINSELHWQAYKETVFASQDKYLDYLP
jgi:hypothetical protein